MKYSYYACHDLNIPAERGDLYRFAGKLECTDGAEAREKAKIVMPIGFVGYVVFVTSGVTFDFADLLVSGTFVDNRS